jgi:3-dehydroquinate synthetase
MCDEKIREKVIGVLKKYGLYRIMEYDWEKIALAAFHDKKADGDTVTVITVNAIGSFEIKKMQCSQVIENAKNVLEGLKQ